MAPQAARMDGEKDQCGSQALAHPEYARRATASVAAGSTPPLDPLIIALARAVDRTGRTAS